MLERVPMFNNIDLHACKELEAIGLRRLYRKNTVVITEGDDTNSLYILLSGSANAIQSDQSGRQLVINRFQPYDAFGEMSFLDGSPRSASVVTNTPCEVMIIPRKRFQALVAERPEIAWDIILYLLSRLRQATRQINDLAFLDVYGRLAHFLEQNQNKDGVVSEKLTQQEIADIIGSSRETVSRIFSELKAGQFIATRKGSIIIKKKLPYNF